MTDTTYDDHERGQPAGLGCNEELGRIPRRCDCTSLCGDDPWLKDGRAIKCHAYDPLHPPPCRHCKGTGKELSAC
jgi:hypothetical protein